MKSRYITGMSKKNRHTGRKSLIYRLPDFPFDYCYLIWMLREYRSPRDKISRMLRDGEIIQIKKGLYIRSPEYGGEINRKVIANLIYGPSYISLDFALQYWGLIPESVELVTSITNKRNKMFDTPVGSFSYKYLHHSKFYPGVLLQQTELSGQKRNMENKTGFFIASEEKALCDKLAAVGDIEKPKDIPDYLESYLRVDTALLHLNIPRLCQIEKAYKKKSVTAFVCWYKSYIGY